MISQWGGVLEAPGLPPTMIVGVHRLADETLRLHEYSPKFDPERFAAHERFFVEDVGAWARSRFGLTLPSGRTAVFGVSAGGELALALGLRHPEIYGAIFSASPGAGYRPPDAMPNRLPRSCTASTWHTHGNISPGRWANWRTPELRHVSSCFARFRQRDAASARSPGCGGSPASWRRESFAPPRPEPDR